MNKQYPDENELLCFSDGGELELNRELVWEWNQIVLQKRFCDTPVGFSSELSKQRAIDIWKNKEKIFRKSQEYCLQETMLSEENVFVGRCDELECLKQCFTTGVGGMKVLLYGMGGIGKTALARKAACVLQKKYDHILWLNYSTDLQHTICNDDQMSITNLFWHSGRYQNQKDYFRKKWEIFCRLAREKRVLLVLDDVNNPKDRNLSRLWELPCDVLLTGRTVREEWKTKNIPVEALRHEWEWQDFYECYCGSVESEEERKRWMDYRGMVQGNTLLMRLAACNSDLCELGAEGMETYFLRTGTLNVTDIKILRYLSLLSIDGIEKNLFLQACKEKVSDVEKLVRMSLVREEEKKGCRIYSLHPVIAESVRKYYKPTPENCSSFINGMAKRYEQLWNEPYENVPRAIPICFAFLQAWAKPKAWQYVAYDVFTNALCMGGYFEEAQVYKKKLYRSCVDYYGEIHQITGYVAIRVGAMYHNSLQFAEAKVWYQKAYDILSQSKPYNGLFEYQRMQAAHTLCRNDRHEGKYDSAMRYLEECLRAHACYMEQNPKAPAHHRQERYFLLLEKAKILVACSKWEEAEALCRELEEEYRNENTEWVHFFEELYLLWAELALKLGKEVEAVQMAKESVSIAQTMRGEYAKETLGCKEVLADAYALANKRSESIECYREILEKLQQYYPLQKEWYQKVYRKECAYVKEENMFSMD